MLIHRRAVLTASILFLFLSIPQTVLAVTPVQALEKQLAAAGALLESGQLDSAESAYLEILQNTEPTDERSYYTDEIYQFAARAQSRLGFIQLERSNTEGAGDDYRAAINALREAYEEHAKRTQLQNSIKQTAGKELKGFLNNRLGKLRSKMPDNVVTRNYDLFGPLAETVQQLVDIPPPAVELGAQRLGEDAAHHETRIPVIPDTDYFRLIGRVVTASGRCTGSLVGKNLVLTNAHCLFERKGKTTKRKKGPFLFRREFLYQLEEFKVNQFYTSTGRGGTWDGQNQNDWAILVLDERSKSGKLPGTWLNTLSDLPELASFGPNASEVFLAGYAGDLNRGLYMTMHKGCSIEPEALQVSAPDAFHNCQRYGGLSGAPIVHLDEDGKPHVVSIHSGSNPGRESDYRSRAVPPVNWYPTLAKLRGR